ncbi:MAG: lysophospholipid acyltransferase family protein [Pseudolabrys sp.]|nr:lysophospholipid acyltransferase family protein [Pseudolabrys sp.]MBV9260387.1 lysophospholipid acyltransferase family protein [Pseudolabrys sp.]
MKRLTRQPWFQKLIGVSAAEYLRFVVKTNRIIIEPTDIYERIKPDLPLILAMWHGQHVLMPFIKRPEHRAKVLISRHRDGEMNAIAAERLGVGTIRGSGSHGTDFHRKGGVGAFREMLDALAEGFNVATTADVPKVARVAGMGIVKLAQLSGRPIYPVAVATSRRIELDNWDKSVINLPFGRFAGAVTEPIRVAADADDAALETARRAIESGLNAATMRAYELADKGKARG